MAYAKKVYPRRRRSSRYRRRYRRRRYRRFNYRRRYRRSSRSKPEYKRKEIKTNIGFQIQTLQIGGDMRTCITANPYEFLVIGCENRNDEPAYCIPIRQGTNIDQRIGAKIRPVALRCFGTVSIEAKTQEVTPVQNGLSSVIQVNACMLRVMIFQVRNGNTDYSALSPQFSGVNPSIINQLFDQEQNAYFGIRSYNGNLTTMYNNIQWFGSIFSTAPQFRTTETLNPGTREFDVKEGLNSFDRFSWGILAKTPYRNGIGASLKILKDKVYHLNPTTAPTFAFRFKTKRPYRMVWKESRVQDNDLTVNCRNPIYIVVFPIYPVGVNISKILVNFNCQMYYTDK